MPDNCTIYCKSSDQGELAKLIHASFKTSTEDENGSTILHGQTGSMRISRKVFRERGDDFCGLLLSTWTHAETLLPFRERMPNKNPLIDRIFETKLVLGIVVDPSYDADESYGDLVFEIAKTLDGIIFNGSDYLDHECKSLTAHYDLS